MKNVFGIRKKDCISIVGAGGKTSLLFLLGNTFEKSLLTTTTKIFRPLSNDVFIDELPESIKTSVIVKKQVDNKLYGFTEDELSKYCSSFDYTFIEADGSRMLPLKGWNSNEPVVPNYSNKTIGVLDITVLDNLTEKSVFRIDEYKKITAVEERVTYRNLVDVVLNSNGLFKGSKYKILYINKVECDETRLAALKLIKMLQDDDRFSLDRIVVGSVHKENFSLEYNRLVNFVLASGVSKRMGKDKLLVEYNGTYLLENITSKLATFPQDCYIVCHNDYRQIASKYDVEILQNDDYHLGQSSSIKRSLLVDCENYGYYLGDMPSISIKTIEELKNKHELITMIRSGEISSAPLLINKQYIDELKALEGDRGAKKVVLNHLEDVKYVEVNSDELFDVDTKEDLVK